MPTTSPIATVATSAVSGTRKTLLQIRTGTSQKVRVIEWGYGFDTAPANNVRMELLETGSVGATVTAHVAAGVMPYSDSGAPGSNVQLGTTHTGYNASAEGSITATRLLDFHYENGLFFKQQYPLGREPEVGADKFLRLCATPTSAAAVNMWAYIIWEE
jgi:hypothetical protein